jgi:arylsulfatase
MISYLDDQVGEIVQKLKDLKIYDSTIIVFTSDNGPSYTGGTDAAYFNSAGPF